MTTGKGGVVIRVLSLCSAVGLGGGYVWQRQKAAAIPAAPELKATEDRSLMPGSKSMAFEGVEGPVWVEADRAMIGSSKSFIMVPPGDKGAEPIIIPGVPSPGESPSAEEPETTLPQRTVLPGSKSIDRILQPPAPEEEP